MPLDRQFRLARIWSNRQLRQLAPLVSGKVVNVSAGDDIDKEGGHYADYFAHCDEYHLTNYSPGAFRGFQGRQREHLFDLRTEVPADLQGNFDVALSHTVLEHVFDVRTAFRNTCELSTDLAIVIVPFAQVQHETSNYADYWRFTPTCLKMLFDENGMEVVYEASNNDPNAAVYVISVGSRHPERWRQVMPEFTRTATAASWIGSMQNQTANPFQRMGGFLQGLAGALRNRKEIAGGDGSKRSGSANGESEATS